MPIYEFECSIHGRFERYFPLSEFDNIIKNGVFCGQILSLEVNFIAGEDFYCLEICEKVWSQVNYPSHGKPTIVFKNPKTGETEVALYEGQKAPDGFVREELKTPHERSKFEKEETNKQKVLDEYRTEERRFAVDHVRKQRHDDLNAKMSSITSKADNPAVAEDLLKRAMVRTRNKKVPAKKSEMRLDVNHMNKTNIDKG